MQIYLKTHACKYICNHILERTGFMNVCTSIVHVNVSIGHEPSIVTMVRGTLGEMMMSMVMVIMLVLLMMMMMTGTEELQRSLCV